MCLVLQLCVKVVSRNFVVYLSCTPFSPCPLTLIHTKTFFFGILTAKKTLELYHFVLDFDEVAVGHIRETFGNLILSLLNQPNWYV